MKDIRVGDVWYCEEGLPVVKYVARVMKVQEYEFLSRDIIINVKDDFLDCGEVWHYHKTNHPKRLLYRGSGEGGVEIKSDHNMWCTNNEE